MSPALSIQSMFKDMGLYASQAHTSITHVCTGGSPVQLIHAKAVGKGTESRQLSGALDVEFEWLKLLDTPRDQI
uniref:Uncharacterized protein n=1 Tax=Knipowitschia caucasica TaxID=637954 RepID=A0AAV2JPW1_KNICA